jgi:hypothetical protein
MPKYLEQRSLSSTPKLNSAQFNFELTVALSSINAPKYPDPRSENIRKNQLGREG